MRKCFSLLLALSLLFSVFAAGSLAEEEEAPAEIVEEVDLDAEEPESPDEVEEEILDEETGEIYVITEEERSVLDELEQDLEIDESIDPDDLEINPNLPDHVINILLVGVDTRSNDPREIAGRGDTEIIVSINTQTGAIKMTSILRDSLVTIPGYKSQQKINNAFKHGCNRKGSNGGAHGGALLAMRTINHNFAMNLQYCVAINFNGLASIIDSLGGIDIALTRAEARYINSYLRKHPPAYDNRAKGERVPLDWDAEKEAGTQEVVDGRLTLHLDGVQAVMYARIRSLKGENDFTRTDRQRHLLDLLLKKISSDMTDFYRLADLASSCIEYAYTNMNLEDIVRVASPVMKSGLLSKVGSDALFESMRVPMDKNYKYAKVDEASVLSFSIKKHAQAIHEFIYGSYYPAK